MFLTQDCTFKFHFLSFSTTDVDRIIYCFKHATSRNVKLFGIWAWNNLYACLSGFVFKLDNKFSQYYLLTTTIHVFDDNYPTMVPITAPLIWSYPTPLHVADRCSTNVIRIFKNKTMLPSLCKLLLWSQFLVSLQSDICRVSGMACEKDALKRLKNFEKCFWWDLRLLKTFKHLTSSICNNSGCHVFI